MASRFAREDRGGNLEGFPTRRSPGFVAREPESVKFLYMGAGAERLESVKKLYNPGGVFEGAALRCVVYSVVMPGGKRPTTREECVPTREEFLAARARELARHNLRVSYMMGTDILTLEDRELLSGDTPADEVRDGETVRRWSAARGPNRR